MATDSWSGFNFARSRTTPFYVCINTNTTQVGSSFKPVADPLGGDEAGHYLNVLPALSRGAVSWKMWRLSPSSGKLTLFVKKRKDAQQVVAVQ